MDTGIIRATEDEALQFHAGGRPGKLSIAPTKALTTQRDLALAYSPGVAFPCLHIHRQPSAAFDYTSKGNFVAVISNGTAVLGLGDLGAPATSTNSSIASVSCTRPLAASTWRTSRRPSALSSKSGCASCWISRYFT